MDFCTRVEQPLPLALGYAVDANTHSLATFKTKVGTPNRACSSLVGGDTDAKDAHLP